MRRRWRLLRGLAIAVLGLVAFGATAIVGLATWARTEGGRAWLSERLVALIGPAEGALAIGRLETNLFSWATARDVTLTRPDGVTIGRVSALHLDYRLGGLSARRLVVPRVRIEDLELTLTRTEAGLDLAALWSTGTDEGPGEPWRGLPFDLVIEAVEVEPVTVTWNEPGKSYTLHDATLRGAVALRGAAIRVDGLGLTAPRTSPELGALVITGDARWGPRTLWVDDLSVALGPNRAALRGGLGALDGNATLGFGLSGLHVEPASLAPLVGELPITGAFDATGAVAGLLAAPTFVLELDTPGGRAHLNALVDTRGPRPAWSAQVVPGNVALDTFLPALPRPTVLRGAVAANGEGFGWPDDLDATATLALEAPRVGEWSDLAARGRVTLANGVVDLANLVASAPGVSARGSGRVRVLDELGSVTLTDARADLRALARFGVPEARGAAGFAGTARFGWGERLGVEAEGDVRATTLAWGDLGAVATATGPVAMRWVPDGGTDVRGALALTGVAGAGVTAAEVRLEGEVRADRDVRVDARVALDGLAGHGASVVHAAGTARVARVGTRLEAKVDLATEGVAWERWRSDSGTVRATLDGDAAALRVDLRDGAREMVVVDGEADLATRAIRARELLVAPTPELAWRGEGVQTARIVDGGVADVRVRLTSASGSLAIEGDVSTEADVALRAEARDVRLDRLAALLPGRFDGYAGRVSLDATLTGRPRAPALTAELSAEDLAIPDVVGALDLRVRADGADGRLALDGAASTRGARLAQISGTLPVSLALAAPGLDPAGALDLRVELPPGGSARWNEVLAGVELPEARASAELTLTGPVRDPALGLVAVLDAPVGRDGEWVRLDVDARTVARRLELRGVLRERLVRRLEIGGGAATRFHEVAGALLGEGPALALAEPASWVSDLDVTAVPMRLPVEVLAGFVGGVPAKLSGDLAGGLLLTGPVAAPRVQGALLLVEGSLGDLELSPAEVILGPAEGGYDVAARVGFGGRSGVEVSGFVPFAPPPGGALADELTRPGLDLRISARDVPITAVAAAWPQLDATAGTVHVDGTVRGALADAAPDLAFGLRGADFFLVPTGVRYRDAGFEGRVTRDALTITELTARTSRVAGGEPGTVRGAVTARREGDHPIFDGTLILDRAWLLDLPEARLQLDGKLRLGEGAGKVRVGGRLAVLDGNLVVPERFFTGSSDLALPADVRVLRRGVDPSAARARASEGFAFPAWLDAEVVVNLDRAAFLNASMPMEQALGEAFRSFSSIQLSTQLDGEVTARVEDGALSLVGEVEPLRGLARVFNRPFDVSGGTISFTGRDYTNPVLDVRAVHDNRDYGPIRVEITGTPSELGLAFSAEEDGLAQEDVLAVLVTGSKLSEVGAGQGDALASLVTSSLVGMADDFSSGARLFDVFELDTSHLRVGTRIRGDANLFLLGEYDWTADPAEENVGEITLEWRITRSWQFDLTTGTSGYSSASLNRKWRF